MTHHELIEHAKSLGLTVTFIEYRDEARRTVNTMYRFWDGDPRGYHHGSQYIACKITEMTLNDQMDYNEYHDSIGPAYNAIKQFESWR